MSFHLFAGTDAGRLENGYSVDNQNDASGSILFRSYLDASLSIQWKDQFGGVLGVLWKPNDLRNDAPATTVFKLGPGISQAFLKWSASDKQNLTVGYFPYKYNADARNLGEYMFRSEAYPTLIQTNKWIWLEEERFRAIGLKLTLGSESFKHDFCLFGETNQHPIFDFSPAYIATWKVSSAFTLGGGISFHRYLSPNDKSRKQLTRDYYYYENFTIPAGQPGSPDSARPKTTMPRLTEDIRNIAAQNGLSEEDYFNDPANVGLDSQLVRFDNRATKLMLFVGFDFNHLLGWDPKVKGPFEFYGEIAQLGLQNYPIFYTHYSQRLPIMLGFSVPTFGMLKTLSFEVEFLANPNIESDANIYNNLDLPPSNAHRYQVYDKDNLKWSLYASRDILTSLSIIVQFANDHLRLANYNARPESVPVTNQGQHWYWLTRIQWSI
jgi:hypothetical protein